MNRPTDDNWHPVADTGELDDEEALAVSVGRFHVALCRVGDRFYAIDNLCTHAFACMAEGLIDGDIIECPLHQAQVSYSYRQGIDGAGGSGFGHLSDQSDRRKDIHSATGMIPSAR